MTRRTMCRLVFGALATTTATALTGCGGGGPAAGMASDADISKISDPMAGVQINDVSKKTRKKKK